MELPKITDEHDALLEEVAKAMGSRHWFLIGVDGREHAGKSTIGRFLALNLNMPCIETDLFILHRNDGAHQEKVEYRDEELMRVIETRLIPGRPMAVEGIFLLKTLERIGMKPDYLIYAVNEDFEGSETRRSQFEAYEKEYRPMEKANKVISLQGE